MVEVVDLTVQIYDALRPLGLGAGIERLASDEIALGARHGSERFSRPVAREGLTRIRGFSVAGAEPVPGAR